MIKACHMLKLRHQMFSTQLRYSLFFKMLKAENQYNNVPSNKFKMGEIKIMRKLTLQTVYYNSTAQVLKHLHERNATKLFPMKTIC